MSYAHIVLTQTYVNYDKLKKLIAKAFFYHQNRTFLHNLEALLNSSDLAAFWNHQLATGTILEPNLDTKQEFTDSLLDFYVQYSQPTLLFLGNLENFSLPMQEGMLKFLEEPPEKLEIILFAQERYYILPTIGSRCQLHRLPKQLVMQLLDQDLLQKTQQKLPPVGLFCKQFLLNGPLVLPDLKNVERKELDFWLWQVQTYLENFYQQQPHVNYFSKLTKVIQARQLNQQNLQKKFVLAWLNT